MKKMSIQEAAQILGKQAPDIKPLIILQNVGGLLGIDADQLLAEFQKWIGTTPLSVQDGADLCHRRASVGAPLPWEILVEPEPEIITADPWMGPRECKKAIAKRAPGISDIEPGDYICFKNGGPVYRLIRVNSDGTLATERIAAKKITRPEDFRIIQKGSGNGQEKRS